MKRILLTLIFTLFVFSPFHLLMAQTEVEPFVPGSTLEGICYYLPRTAFRVTVIAEKTTTRPGDFHKYADRFLRMPNVPTEESVQWNLKSITLEPYGKPDKNKAYSIKLKSKTVAPLVGLSRDGLLLSINCDAQESFLPDLPKPEKGAAPENPRSYRKSSPQVAQPRWQNSVHRKSTTSATARTPSSEAKQTTRPRTANN